MKISLRRVFRLILLTSVLSLSVEIKDRDGIRIVRKKIKLPITRENDEELVREGRNLGYKFWDKSHILITKQLIMYYPVC